MSTHGTPLRSQQLNASGGSTRPSPKKPRLQSHDEKEEALCDLEAIDGVRSTSEQEQGLAQGQDAAGGQADPQLTAEPESLMDTVAAGIFMMQTRQKAVNAKVSIDSFVCT